MKIKKLSDTKLELTETTETKTVIEKWNIEEQIAQHEEELVKLNSWLQELKK